MKVLLALLVTLLAACSPAQGATVDVVEGQGVYGTAVNLRYRAGPGEVNRLTMSQVAATVTVRDTGARLTAGHRCTLRPDGSATCDVRGREGAEVELGDGNDEAHLDLVFGSVLVRGGTGDDVLTGSRGRDVLFGGGGSDILRAGGGDDELYDGDVAAGALDADTLDGGAGSDSVSYDDERTTPVVVDLQTGAGPDNDRLGSVESVSGTRFADDLRGSDGENYLDGGDGDDRIDGRGGDDDVLGSAGDDTLIAGDGDDRVFDEQGTNTIDLGAGDDNFATDGLDGASAHVTCGGGRDTITDASYTDRYAPDCEFLKNALRGYPFRGGAEELSAQPIKVARGAVGFHAACPPQGCTVRLELYEHRRGRRHGPLLGRSNVRRLPAMSGRLLSVPIRGAILQRLRGRSIRVEAVLVRRTSTAEFPVRIRFSG